METDRPQCVPASKRRRISLTDSLSRITFSEPTAPVYERASTPTIQAPQPFQPADRIALKKALEHLAADALSSADFVVLANRFGYHAALHSFALNTLPLSDWLALDKRAILQIVEHDFSFFDFLPPEAITSNTHLAAYPGYRQQLFERVPDRLEEAFFAEAVKTCPSAVFDMPANQRTPARLQQACRAKPWMLAQLSAELRTVELVTEICQRTGYGLQYLPEKNRSYELCLKACQTKWTALEYVPEALKDEAICRIALSQSGLAYRWLPAELSQSAEWQLLACQKSGTVLQWIPKEQHNDALREAACYNNATALKFIDPKQITYKLCRLACLAAADKACQYIPERHLDEPMRRLICMQSTSIETFEEFKPDNVDFYEQLLEENIFASLAWVPKTCRSPVHYLLACRKMGTDLELVPEQYRTAEICLAACRNSRLALPWVPARYGLAQSGQSSCEQSEQACQPVAKEGIGLEWFVETLHSFIDGIYENDGPYELLSHARRLLSDADFQSLLESSVLCSKSLKVAMLTHLQVSPAQKKQLLEWMLEPEIWPTPVPPKESDLCEMANPLLWSLANPDLLHLNLAAVKRAAHWAPPRGSAGRQLLAAIEQELRSAVLVQPDASEPLLQSQGTPAGGRTLKINQGELAHHYKFQRKGESLKTLMQEGAVHTVREKHPELFGPLHSNLPSATRFFRLYLDQLPAALPQFADPLEIAIEQDGRRYVHLYRCLLYTSPSPRDRQKPRMPSSA